MTPFNPPSCGWIFQPDPLARKQAPLALTSQEGLTGDRIEKQKAIVKPHVLTHVIEGFVIQEGPEPFPVSN